MELCIIGLLFNVILSVRVVILKVSYFKAYATCLDYHAAGGFQSRPLYEYELIESGEKAVYRNRGIAFGYPRKRKTYKVLIKKNDHNKIVAYNEIIGSVILISILTICLVVELFFYVGL